MKMYYSLYVSLLFIGLCCSVSQATTCTERGRFPDDENPECRGYVMCLAGGITNFTQYKLTCPEGSIYNHLEQQCTAHNKNYKCNPDFNCTMVKNFEDPLNKNCSSYISCVQGMDGIATARSIECPINTLFNVTVGECMDKNITMCHPKSNNALSISITLFSLLFNIIIVLIL